jgi:hypothetical protein
MGRPIQRKNKPNSLSERRVRSSGMRNSVAGRSPTFRRNVSPPSSRLQKKKTRNLWNEWESWVSSSETSGSLRTAPCCNSEYLTLRNHCRMNLKTSTAEPKWQSPSQHSAYLCGHQHLPALQPPPSLEGEAPRTQQRPCQLQWGFWGRC